MAEPVPPATPASWPRLAVSAAIFKDNRFLLVQRARAPALGIWTLPGGRVEFGEGLHQALNREVQEETGLTIAILGLAGFREALPNPARHQPGHFVILPFAARWTAGEVNLNEELADFRWITPSELGGFKTTEGLAEVIETATRIAGV